MMAGVTVRLVQLDDELNEMVPVMGVNLNSAGCHVHAAMPRSVRESAQDGRTVRRSECGSRPSTRTVPDVAGASPSTTSSREVFPAPLVPSKANSSPRRTEKLTPRTASNPPPPLY